MCENGKIRNSLCFLLWNQKQLVLCVVDTGAFIIFLPSGMCFSLSWHPWPLPFLYFILITLLSLFKSHTWIKKSYCKIQWMLLRIHTCYPPSHTYFTTWICKFLGSVYLCSLKSKRPGSLHCIGTFWSSWVFACMHILNAHDLLLEYFRPLETHLHSNHPFSCSVFCISYNYLESIISAGSW